MRTGITACIAAHPGRLRNGKLVRALASVAAQTRQPEAIAVGNDVERLGAAHNRQHILDSVGTEWMAWLDSDDEWLPQHLEHLWQVAQSDPSIGFVYPWFEPVGGGDPLGHFGLPFNPATPHHTTITFLVKTDLAREVGFGPDYLTETPARLMAGEDWLHIVGLCQLAVARDLRMVHLPERTWRWHMDGGNSSGIPGQGDAT